MNNMNLLQKFQSLATYTRSSNPERLTGWQTFLKIAQDNAIHIVILTLLSIWWWRYHETTSLSAGQSSGSKLSQEQQREAMIKARERQQEQQEKATLMAIQQRKEKMSQNPKEHTKEENPKDCETKQPIKARIPSRPTEKKKSSLRSDDYLPMGGAGGTGAFRSHRAQPRKGG